MSEDNGIRMDVKWEFIKYKMLEIITLSDGGSLG